MFVQIDTLLFPTYKGMTHVQHLGPYSVSNKSALLTIANIAKVLVPGLGDDGAVVSGVEVGDSPNPNVVHSLRLDGRAVVGDIVQGRWYRLKEMYWRS